LVGDAGFASLSTEDEGAMRRHPSFALIVVDGAYYFIRAREV
jgi:hypothetical protein